MMTTGTTAKKNEGEKKTKSTLCSPFLMRFFLYRYNGDQIVSVRTENVEEGAEQMNAVRPTIMVTEPLP